MGDEIYFILCLLIKGTRDTYLHGSHYVLVCFWWLFLTPLGDLCELCLGLGTGKVKAANLNEWDSSVTGRNPLGNLG